MAKIKYNAKVWEATTTEWAADNTIYSPNDLLFDTVSGIYKRGNGVNKYSDLPALGEVAAWSDITGKPSVIAAGSTAAEAWAVIDDAAIGTTATTAAAGNHDHAVVEDTASGLAAAANIQALAIALSTRIKALEDAPAE
jgi:hypothetical protein